MLRILEPELMDDPEQALAYAEADFDSAHQQIMEQFIQVFPAYVPHGRVLDLGCGPADISVRFARLFTTCRIDGIDGAESMLTLGRLRIDRSKLMHRISLYRCELPTQWLPNTEYETIISNSLLHHLHDPMVLWETVMFAAMAGTRVFIGDLRRPPSAQQAAAIVTQYAGTEPEVLRHDFYNSLCAAFTPTEISAQLERAGLKELRVKVIDPVHVIIHGCIS